MNPNESSQKNWIRKSKPFLNIMRICDRFFEAQGNTATLTAEPNPAFHNSMFSEFESNPKTFYSSSIGIGIYFDFFSFE